MESFLLGPIFVDYQRFTGLLEGIFLSIVLLRYNARKCISLLHTCGDVNLWVDLTINEIHQHWSPTNNDESTVSCKFFLGISNNVIKRMIKAICLLKITVLYKCTASHIILNTFHFQPETNCVILTKPWKSVQHAVYVLNFKLNALY